MDQTPDLLAAMSDSVYQTLLETHQQHPDWFQKKFKSYSWENSQFKDKLINRLTENLTSTENSDTVILKIISLLLNIFLPIFFSSQIFTRLVVNLRQLSHCHQNILSDDGLAVLLLDAENLSLEIKMENLLERLSSYPLKIKLAVANWRGLGKKDEDLRQRGYDLIHVPAGKNSADLAMISLGTSFFLDSSLVKEVFVCSCDKDLEPLTTKLSKSRLIVHRVSRKADEMIIVNTQTNKTRKYSISSIQDLPSLQDFITQLKQIILEEQAKTQKNWVQLARVSQLYSDKHGSKITQVVNYVLPGKRARDIFIEFKEDFVTHQISEKSQMYVTLFEEIVTVPEIVENSNHKNKNQKLINKETLITAVVTIIKIIIKQSKQEYIPIETVAAQFQKEFNLSVTQAIKTFQLNQKFPDFLKSCHQLKLKKEEKVYQVALK